MILISTGNQGIVKLEPKEIGEEEFLQSYINQNPEVIPLDDLKDGVRLLILGREFPTQSGPIDVLALDQDGDLYIIETKLFKNADKRKVIAQMFDYGAALWNTSVEEFEENMNSASRSQFDNKSLVERVTDFLSDNEGNPEDVIRQALTHKDEGSITFIVLMDQIDQRLKMLIRYINANSKFDVLGVSLDFYAHEDTEIVIPDLYGAEIRKELATKSGVRRKRKWDEASYFDQMRTKNLTAEIQTAIEALYLWSRDKADSLKWGTGETGSFGPYFQKTFKRSLFSVYSNGDTWMRLRDDRDSPETKIALKKIEKALTEWEVIDSDFNREVNLNCDAFWTRIEQYISLIEETFSV